MMTAQQVLGYFKAELFRPIRLHMASGRTFDIRYSEVVKILKNSILVFKATGEGSDLPDEWESISLKQTESVSHLEVPVS